MLEKMLFKAEEDARTAKQLLIEEYIKRGDIIIFDAKSGILHEGSDCITVTQNGSALQININIEDLQND